MAYRLAKRAEADLEDIAYYIAKESGSLETARRVIESIMGGPDEATYYVTECGAAWHRTPGAVAWLTKLAATLAPKRRTRATMH
jgi:hypothetical protein